MGQKQKNLNLELANLNKSIGSQSLYKTNTKSVENNRIVSQHRSIPPYSNPTSKKRKRRRKRILIKNIMIFIILLSICIILLCILFFYASNTIYKNQAGTNTSLLSAFRMDNTLPVPRPEWTEDFLTPNEYSRPGTSLRKVKNIFVHYTANPGTSAAQNRNYFEQLKDTHETSASSHFIIGYEGEIIQCIPLDEMAYAVMTRNEDSISIECCYQNEDGSFSNATYDSLVSLLKWLVANYQLDAEDILRHYDCGGKKCPLYYVENDDAWGKLIADI